MNDEVGNKNLKDRLRSYSLRIIALYNAIPQTGAGAILAKQVLRSATSVGAHYREALRARSQAEFISKLGGGIQELDETEYWLDLLSGAGILSPSRLSDILSETNELLAILTASIKTAKSNLPK